MFNLSPRAILIGSVSVTAIIVAAGIIFAVFPLINEVNLLSSDIKNKKTAAETLAARREQKSRLKDSYESIAADIGKIESQFINRDSLVLFLQDTESLSASAGVDLKINLAESASSSRGKREGEIVASERFLLSVTGDFGNLVKFLGALENSRYFNKVDNVLVRKLDNYEISRTPGLSAGDAEGLINIQVFSR